MGLEIEWGSDMGQGLPWVRDGVKITDICHAYYWVMRCTVWYFYRAILRPVQIVVPEYCRLTLS